MTTRKKIVLSLGIMLSMLIALVVSVVGFQPKVSNNTSSEGTGSTPNNNVSTNVDTNLDAKVEKPATYTYQPGEIEVQKGGSTLNFTYTPSVNAMEGEEDAIGSEEEGEDTTTTPITKAYEYIFGNVMDKTIAINLNYIDATGVNISYAWSDTRLDTSTSITTYTSFTTQTIQANGTDKYIYIIVSPTDTTIPTTFTKNIWWNYGKVGKVSIVNNAGATDVEQEIVKGQYIYEEDLKTPTAPNGYYFDAWFMDSNYTQLATFPIQSQGQSLYARFANLPENWLSLNGDEYMVVNGGEQLSGAVVIPTMYNGLPVTSMSATTMEEADITKVVFIQQTNITSIDIPNTITNIPFVTFGECDNLSEVILPQTLITIEFGAFQSCSSLTSVDLSKCTSLTTIGDYAFNSTALTSIDLSNCTNLTTIGDYAFQNCSSLTSITLPSSLTTIGKRAFESCNGLTNITLPSSVITIGEKAFSYCSGLTNITLPNSLTSIGIGAFGYCYALAEVYNLSSLDIVAGADTHGMVAHYAGIVAKHERDESKLVTIDGVYYYKNSETDYIALRLSDKTKTSITLDSRTTSIGNYAFYGCTSLTSVDLSNCTNLTTIGNYAFDNCTSLTSIDLPSSLTTIGNYAFYNCTSLTSITLPSSLTTIGTYAFSSCTSLTSIDLSACTSLTTIGDFAFYSTALTNIDLSNCVNLTTIGEHAFSSCTSLTSITLPSSLTTIGASAFGGCTALESVNLGDCVNLTTIGNSAFAKCSALTSVVIPSNVTKIGQYAFSSCTNLGSLTFAVDGTWYSGTTTQQTTMDGGTSYTIVADTDYSSTFKSSTYYWYKK
ncbi:MAG: leucine-rich repeat protein [Clostridia bacterium]|nr:leucine-rich repeat protein [Clostridia bacterium]